MTPTQEREFAAAAQRAAAINSPSRSYHIHYGQTDANRKRGR